MNNTEIIRDRNQPPRLHIKPWDECVCSVMPLNTNRAMSLQPYQTADGYEYNWILTKKPERNVVQMAIDTDNLDFLYQPPLKNLNSDGSTWEPNRFGGRSFRPANVNGSYAVYHKTMAGDYTRMGGKNYIAGKAFHIYRPRIEDSAGHWCWGVLNIDGKAGLLTVTISQDFLDKAVYPVHHAAGLEFGYKSVGATNDNGHKHEVYLAYAGGGDPATPASSGTLTNIVAYLTWDGGNTPHFNPAIYTNVAGEPNVLIQGLNSGGTLVPGPAYTPSWVSTPISASIVSGTVYWLGYTTDYPNNVYIYFDSGGQSRPDNDDATWQNPWVTKWAAGTYKSSIYAIYTASSANTGNMLLVY